MSCQKTSIQAMRTMNRLVAKIELDNGVRFSVYEDSLPLLIGRDSSCDICIPISQVSRQHCELYIENDALCIRDLSTYGTMIGGRKLNGESTSIQGPTTIRVAREAMIKITPSATGDMSEDRRLILERRHANRRQRVRRTTNVTVVQFERRLESNRRSSQRRADARRSQTT